MDGTDPPLYIFNPVYEDKVIDAENNIDFNVLFHSYKHADFLRKKAIEVGLEYSGAYQETPIEFIKRNLKQQEQNIDPQEKRYSAIRFLFFIYKNKFFKYNSICQITQFHHILIFLIGIP